MELNLKNKVALVTGASRGIGYAIAQTLSAEGMRVALVARSQDLLEQLAATLPIESLVIAADLRHPTAPAEAVSATHARFGALDLLVNNAGATKRGDFLELTEDDWQDGFALKFYSAVRCSRAAWKHLQTSRGSIINIIGVGGRTGTAEFAIGGAVNAALMNLTKVLADRGVKDGVRVNALNPGSIATERLQVRIKKLAQEQKVSEAEAASLLAQKQGIARFGQPEEIARAVAFLASSQSAYLQGSIIDVDGGQTRTL